MTGRVRSLLALLLSGALIWLLAGCGEDSGEGETTGSLFVQTAADGGTLSGQGDRLTLTLDGVPAVTTTFTDRPERISGTMLTAVFDRSFEALFEDSAPNATLSSLERGKGEFVLELSNPRYDERARTLAYSVVPVGIRAEELPRRFGPISLFIDDAQVGFSSRWKTSMHVYARSQYREPCKANGIAGQPYLIKPKVIEAPDDWATEPPEEYDYHLGSYEIFNAASRHGSTRFEVQYDLICSGEQLGTITFEGAVPQSSSKPNQFDCSMDIAPYEDTHCKDTKETGYHVRVDADMRGP